MTVGPVQLRPPLSAETVAFRDERSTLGRIELTTFIWMFFVLKIPIAALLWLVWWAAKEPEPLAADEDEGGSKRPDRPHGPRPSRPPRRGPGHGTPLPAPPRVRTPAVGRRTDTPR